MALIVITTYDGIQTKARNSKTVSVIKAYKKALMSYAVEHGSYPTNSSACLGEGYSSGTCFRSSPAISESTNFNNKLRPYMGNVNPLPLPDTTVFASGSTSYLGATMFYNPSTTLDNQSHYWWIVYYLDTTAGSVGCSAGPVASMDGWPNLSSTPPSNNKTLAHSSGFAECWIPMPNPSTV